MIPTPRGLRVALGLAASLAVGASACGDASAPLPSAPDAAALRIADAPLPALVAEPVVLTVPTYDNTGESVHPDVVEFPRGWNGWRYWLTMTPYARSDSKVENPSILVSANGADVEVPAGLRNPLIPHRGHKGDYNSDPELVFEPQTGRLVLFYRFVSKNSNTIFAVSSTDGRTWKQEPKSLWVRAHGAVSPTVVPAGDGHPATLWYVDTGPEGCKTGVSRVMVRTSTVDDGRVTGPRWGAPVPTTLAQPGYVVWHMKARWIPSKREYWAVYAAFQPGPQGCLTDDLFFARSKDGVTWESFPEPLLRHEDREWTAAALYRSSFLYDPASDELRVWISARGADQKWRMGLARFRYRSLVGELTDGVQAARDTTRFPVAPLPVGEQPPEDH